MKPPGSATAESIHANMSYGRDEEIKIADGRTAFQLYIK